MGEIARIAFRNWLRHPVKGAVVGGMLFLSANLFFITASIAENSQHRWRDYFSRTLMGHYHVTTYSGPDIDYTFPALKMNNRFVPAGVVEYLESAGVAYTPRIKQGAAVYNDESNRFEGEPACLVGIDFNKELPRLDNMRMVAGSIDPEMSRGVLVWEEYAKSHNWQVGQEITLYIKDIFHYTYPYTFEVMGVFNHYQGSVLEGIGFWMVYPLVIVSYETLHDITAIYLKETSTESSLYSELAVWDPDLEHVRKIRKLTQNSGSEVFFAEEGYGSIKGIVQAINFVSGFIHFFILIIIFFAVANLNLIGFLERRREIGTILAIGARPPWVLKLLLTETVGFTVIVYLFSLLFYAVLPFLLPRGIDFGKLNIFFADHHFFFTLVPGSLLEAFVIIMLTMLASVAYPLYLTTQLNPVEVFQEGNV